MHPYLRRARERRTHIINDIRQLVECESFSRSPAHVNRCVDLLVEQTLDLAVPRRVRAKGFGDHLQLTFRPSQKKTRGQLLLLGHSDTVWPIGTLAHMPFRQTQGSLRGPGVYDMKAGLVFACQAVRLLRDLDVPVERRVVLLVVSDEEIGSGTSRALTESLARQSDAVLVLEPGTGLAGKLKTARKGVGRYRLEVAGKAAHAGVDFAAGSSAIVELAHQVVRVAAFTNFNRGITVNPGLIAGGTASNVVAAAASVDIDVRVSTAADERRMQAKMEALKPVDPHCRLLLSGGPNRPPMPRTPQIGHLFASAQRLAATLDIPLEESSTGGGSDGNFTAALGIPTLDGLGAVGAGAHAPGESVLLSCLSPRVALLAALIAGL